MKKRFLSFLIVMCMFLINIPVNATCSAGINGNGTGGIYIDINSAPYTTFAGYSYGVPCGRCTSHYKHTPKYGQCSR